jgi:surfeit locus 1 family protein
VNRSVITASLFALVGFAILISLGVWQLERKAWKENLIATLNARIAAPPHELPSSPNQEADEFSRVHVRGEFAAGENALVYTAGSALRPDVSGPGYWVMSPLRTPEGATVIVNRGFVAGKNDIALPPIGEVELTGALRWPDENSLFTPADDPVKNVWYRRDPVAIAASKGWSKGEKVAPFFIEQEAPQRTGAPQVGPLVVKLRDNHLGYAMTWLGLAGGLAGVYLVWLRGRLRR